MNYKSITQLNWDILNWLQELPHGFDLIVGIPRSGLLIANLLSLYLNLPVTDVDGLLNNRVLSYGERLKSTTNRSLLKNDEKLNILVVDDSLWSGNQINDVRNQIMQRGLRHTIRYGVLYIFPGTQRQVDYFFEEVPFPRIFQWNIMNSNVIEKSCVDIDGVLCLNPSEDENDDGVNYIQFLENAKPYWIPKVRIKAIVTCRLEKYRKITKTWLQKYCIEYESLHMMDLPDKIARIEYGHAKYKAEIFNSIGAKYFIESSYKQACEISKLIQRPVFCVETMDFIKY